MKPKQFFFGLLGALALTLILAGGGYYFALQQLKTESAQLSVQLAEQKSVGTSIEELGRLQRQYDKDIVPILPLIDAALPRNKKQTEILAQLQTLARTSGLQITSVNMPSPVGVPSEISQTVKTGQVLALPISFQLSGTYAQLQTFTSKVENLNRYSTITNLAISRPDKSKPVVYAISLNAYILP